MAKGTYVRPKRITHVVTSNSEGITVEDVLNFAEAIDSLHPSDDERMNEVTTVLDHNGKTIRLVAELDYRGGATKIM